MWNLILVDDDRHLCLLCLFVLYCTFGKLMNEQVFETHMKGRSILKVGKTKDELEKYKIKLEDWKFDVVIEKIENNHI